MALIDLPLEQLHSYRSPRSAPPGHTRFWDRTLAESRAAGEEMHCEPVESGLAVFDAYDVRFPGFAGEPVHAWWLVPRVVDQPLPVVVEFLGYGGGRGLVHERMTWAA